MNAPYYNVSNKTSEYFIWYFILVMVFAIPVLSFVYITLIHYMPFVYLNFVFTIGCGALLGRVVNHAVDFGKARRPVAVLVLTFIALCILKHNQWCVYVPMVVADVYGFPMTLGRRIAGMTHYFARPGELAEAVRVINRYGAWGFTKSARVTGVFLHFIWIAEFVLMTAAATITSWGAPLRPFSEKADDWYSERKDKIESDMPADFAGFKYNMENGRFDELLRLTAAGKTDKTKSMRITLYQPPRDIAEEPYYLTIEQVAQNKGKAKAKVLAEYIRIDAVQAKELTNKDRAPAPDTEEPTQETLELTPEPADLTPEPAPALN